jgi:hypothetical protein
MIDIVSIFSTQQFQKKKHVMKWLESSLQPKGPRVQSSSQIFVSTNEIDEKIHRIFKYFLKLVDLRK